MVENFYNVAGIKSPGLSAAPAIAKYVAELINMKFKLREKIVVITVTTFLLVIGANIFITGRMFRKEYYTALQSKMDTIANTLRSQIERLTGLGITIQNI